MLSLQKLINHHFNRLFLIPVLTLELALITLYFLVNGLVVHESREELLYERSQNLSEQLNIQAMALNNRFSSVRQLTELLQRQHQDYFKEKRPPFRGDQTLFELASNGTFVKKDGAPGASVFVSRSHAHNPDTQNKVYETEYWDNQLKYTVEQSPLVIAAYFNSYDNLNRYYPFIKNTAAQFDADMNLEDYNFYYLANQQHNPERTVQWTPAYIDPAGQGWLISAIAPIYNGDFLEGVTGLDITLQTMVEEIESLALPFHGEAFLVDDKGRIIAMSHGAQQLLNLTQLTEHNYQKPITETLEEPSEFLIQKLPFSSFSAAIVEMFEQDKRNSSASSNFSDYLLSSQPIPETGWILFSITNAEQVLAHINELDQTSYELGIMAIATMLLFYVIFYYVVKHSSGRLAKQISRPLSLMMIPPDQRNHIDQESINSIKELAQFSEKIDQHCPERALLAARQSADERSEISEDEGENLTHLLNCSAFIKMGDQLLESALQQSSPLTLILFEISEYQLLVQQHGQQAAEELKAQCSSCTERVMPEQALLAHINAAQYAILLPNMEQKPCLMAARRLKSELFLAIEINRSSSISIQFSLIEAEQSHYESIQLMLERSQLLLEKNRGNRQNLIHTLEGTTE